MSTKSEQSVEQEQMDKAMYFRPFKWQGRRIRQDARRPDHGRPFAAELRFIISEYYRMIDAQKEASDGN